MVKIREEKSKKETTQKLKEVPIGHLVRFREVSHDEALGKAAKEDGQAFWIVIPGRDGAQKSDQVPLISSEFKTWRYGDGDRIVVDYGIPELLVNPPPMH